MALVCPAGHPPGVGTKFCRLCGRDYLEVGDPVLDAPPPTEAVVPAQAPAVEQVPVAAGAVWPPPPVPVVSAPVVPAPPAAPSVEMVPVPATGGLQVHLPLEQLPDLSGDSELEVALPTPGRPAPTDTVPVDLGAPVLTAPEEEPAAPRLYDRTVVLAGVLAGFLGGGVSGVALAHFLL